MLYLGPLDAGACEVCPDSTGCDVSKGVVRVGEEEYALVGIALGRPQNCEQTLGNPAAGGVTSKQRRGRTQGGQQISLSDFPRHCCDRSESEVGHVPTKNHPPRRENALDKGVFFGRKKREKEKWERRSVGSSLPRPGLAHWQSLGLWACWLGWCAMGLPHWDCGMPAVPHCTHMAFSLHTMQATDQKSQSSVRGQPRNRKSLGPKRSNGTGSQALPRGSGEGSTLRGPRGREHSQGDQRKGALPGGSKAGSTPRGISGRDHSQGVQGNAQGAVSGILR